MRGAKEAATPCVKQDHGDSSRDELLDDAGYRLARTVGGICLYLAVDRYDVKYAVKEASKTFHAPTQETLRRLKRIGRWLLHHRRCVWLYRWQEPGLEFHCWVDSDHAGTDDAERRSTSGGFLTRGPHPLVDWSSQQSTTALSSAEAEFNALVKGIIELLFAQNLVAWFEDDQISKGALYTDSTAGHAMISRLV